MTLVVRLASVKDLGICAAHMRRVLDEDLRGYHPRWHRDVDDLAGTYLDRAGRALFVAELDGTFAGTTTVKPGGPATPPAPTWLGQRYSAQPTGQLARVWIVRELRRRGIGHALVTAATQWALGPGQYTLVCLHTDASSTGALDFWRAYPAAVEVFDARPDPWDTVHFELDSSRLPSAGQRGTLGSRRSTRRAELADPHPRPATPSATRTPVY
jgi:GNAT superfamily N-acetyltransferase